MMAVSLDCVAYNMQVLQGIMFFFFFFFFIIIFFFYHRGNSVVCPL